MGNKTPRHLRGNGREQATTEPVKPSTLDEALRAHDISNEKNGQFIRDARSQLESRIQGVCGIPLSQLDRESAKQVFAVIAALDNVDMNRADRLVDRTMHRVQGMLAKITTMSNQKTEPDEQADRQLPEGMLPPRYAGHRPVEERV